MTLNMRWENDSLYLEVYVTARASRNKIAGSYNGKIKIYLTSPAVDGKANAHLIKFLAEYFDVAKNKVKIINGEHNRTKLIKIESPSRNIELKT